MSGRSRFHKDCTAVGGQSSCPVRATPRLQYVPLSSSSSDADEDPVESSEVSEDSSENGEEGWQYNAVTEPFGRQAFKIHFAENPKNYLHIKRSCIFGGSVADRVRLVVANGSSYSVDVKAKKNGDVIFTSGWTAFAEKMTIAAGSTLVFVNDAPDVFRVFVFSALGEEVECSRQGPSKAVNLPGTKKGAPRYIFSRGLTHEYFPTNELKRVQSLLPHHRPIYVFRMTQSATHIGNLTFNQRFAEYCFSGSIVEIEFSMPPPTAKFAGRLTYGHDGFIRATCGWKRFVKAQNLQVDDICAMIIMKNARKDFYLATVALVRRCV